MNFQKWDLFSGSPGIPRFVGNDALKAEVVILDQFCVHLQTRQLAFCGLSKLVSTSKSKTQIKPLIKAKLTSLEASGGASSEKSERNGGGGILT